MELLVKNKIQRLKTPGSHLWVCSGSYKKNVQSATVSPVETLLDREIDTEIEKTVDELLDKENFEKKSTAKIQKVIFSKFSKEVVRK